MFYIYVSVYFCFFYLILPFSAPQRIKDQRFSYDLMYYVATFCIKKISTLKTLTYLLL